MPDPTLAQADTTDKLGKNGRSGARPALPNLTSLRFFAASYVLLFHTRGGVWFRSGITGVTLFFVLSGFILAYNYPSIPIGGRRKFYLSRFARIYPLYVVSCFGMFPWFLHDAAPKGTGYMATAVVAYLTMVQTWWPPLHFAVNAGGWTLSVEAFFYLVFPFLITRLGRFRKHWQLGVAISYIVLLVPTLIAVLVLTPAHPASATTIHDVLGLPLFHMAEFFIGIFFGLRFLDRLPQFSGWTVLGATVLCLAALALVGRIPSVDSDIVVNGIMALPYGLLIYAMAGWKSPVFGSSLLQLGGEISYSIYLLQWIMVQMVQTLFHHYRGLVPLRFFLFLVVAFLSYQFIEKPCRKLLLRWFGIRSHPKPIETPQLVA